MSLATITIEQFPQRWVAEVEVGGLVARREMVRADTIEALLDGVYDAYRRMVPETAPKPAPVVHVPPEPVEMPEIRVGTREDRGAARRGPGRPRKSAA